MDKFSQLGPLAQEGYNGAILEVEAMYHQFGPNGAMEAAMYMGGSDPLRSFGAIQAAHDVIDSKGVPFTLDDLASTRSNYGLAHDFLVVRLSE